MKQKAGNALQKKIKKIHIIGGAGSGKTYLARVLSDKLAIPAADLDNLFWNKSYGTKKDLVIRDRELEAVLSKDAWIMEGVYYGWLDTSFEKADQIIVLHTNMHLRQMRIILRFLKRKLRILPTKKESLKDLMQLLKWNTKYDTNNLAKALRKIEAYEEKVVHIYNKRELNQFLKKYQVKINNVSRK
ncbi:hypothetical protein [Oceanobacillus sojae]|uniref:DNA topology modulation protein FlaR n=1 Tax=Oceanobacillus sojae TaxID=582851 RepID=A0A511ZFC5_9BACI|nr:hypothetical protein [Oceanobacillus sojae]GEN86153.1 DNA topology modulation protein FlaR [Oceanobacillus sojae]